ncbi:MAG: PTS sugar transporter subunit IIC [Erysipelotrichaceae bacterium]|uniref:PTS sugar transporter subunit IIC n=1 Tax=Floccifex sp. TaxID=2815810 RepID=UPI002A7653B6|nr:PTS sugar transporter subunit IIC [Floccifex sp.]MDD7282091.1 PTS sugar transporter subunit IIC [Erysipelotrichaceae bacterium]MDY2958775.1 PTS sugar transporter subunit IIC [Floccifex sp.]
MMNKLEQWLTPMAEAIGRNKYLIAIRDGFLVSTPLLIVGSIFLLLANFPIPAWTNFIEGLQVGNTSFAALLGKQSDATFTIMAIFATMGIGYSFAKQLKTSGIFGAAVSLMSWFILMPYEVTGKIRGLFDASGAAVEVAEGLTGTVSGVSLGWLGAKGIFVGIICALVSVHIYAWVEKKGWVIKMPAGVPPTVVQSFAALIPAGVVMTIFFLVNTIFVACGTNAFEFIFTFLQTPLLGLGDTLGAMIIAYIFLHLFWFFGVNGGSVVGAVFNPILQTLALENLDLYREVGAAGYTVANGAHIISQQFQDLFATFGGCGSTLSLLIAMLLFCKSKRIKELGKLSLVPGIFGINEPIVFGLPIVLNPTILVPFILVPTINIILSYFAMKVGLFPPCNGINIPWTTPVIISGLLATNWVGALFQGLLLILGVFIYMPFIKIIDKQYLKDEEMAANAQDDEDDIDLDNLSFDDL